ncbi:MAG TPA: sulfite exporter TauE/SafE family protein [Candidatus Paceibacterota bacterium]|nr:sulfite exporter TauE/SafE family protein [Candidatus Paceibacterota bacterium]
MAEKTYKFHVKGMHCASCELLVEERLRVLEGVTRVKANQKKGEVVLYFEGSPPPEKEIEEAVRNAGYRLGDKESFKPVKKDYQELFQAAGVLFILYVFFKTTGLVDFYFNFGDKPTYPVILLIGLTAGVSSCMVIVGGLVLGLSARHAEKHPEASVIQKFRPHLFFNLGRVIGYAALGGLIGLLGSSVNFSNSLTGVFIALAGIFMLFLGLRLIEIFPAVNRFKLTLPAGLAKTLGLGKEVKEYSHLKSFVLGSLTFFLPCGFTQAMQIYALSTGSFVAGVIIMSIFALGTAPGLLGIGGLTSITRGAFARSFFKFAGLVVILLGFFNLSSGLSLTGFSLPKFSDFKKTNQGMVAEINDSVQVVWITQLANGYKPNKITVKKGVPVRLVVESTTLYSCAANIVIPKLKISKVFQLGENVIEFTPEEAGPLAFTCRMGMFNGVINVVD